MRITVCLGLRIALPEVIFMIPTEIQCKLCKPVKRSLARYIHVDLSVASLDLDISPVRQGGRKLPAISGSSDVRRRVHMAGTTIQIIASQIHDFAELRF